MKKNLFKIIALIFCLGTVFGTIRNVPGTYATIQAGINAAVNGDTVLVEPGTYMENINFRGRNIVLTSRFYQTGSTSTIWSTIINGSNPVYPDSGSCVIINNHEDSTAVIQGFNITGGTGTKWNDEHSAGIFREGGGILVALSNPVIQFNIIQNNRCVNTSGVVSTGGGGMRIGDCYIKVFNNVVMNNTGLYGSGIVFNFAGCMLKNNVICSNYGSSSYGAGAVWINGSNARMKIMENNTIAGNSSAGPGTGGICISSGIVNSIRNCIIWGNTSSGNQQITGSPQYVYYSDVQGGVTGTGNINLNPMFADSNYYLSTGSPCIDAGDTSAAYNDPADPIIPTNAKLPAKGTLRNDMGAYGGPLSNYLSNLLISIHQISSSVPGGFALNQNYPNPFNPSTTITYQVPVSGSISLKLYDITGKEVNVLINQIQNPGTYRFDFDASTMPSGVYFYKLDGRGFSQTRKMVLIK